MKMPSQQTVPNGCYAYEEQMRVPENAESVPNEGVARAGAQEPVPQQNQGDMFAEYMWMENLEEFDKQVKEYPRSVVGLLMGWGIAGAEGARGG